MHIFRRGGQRGLDAEDVTPLDEVSIPLEEWYRTSQHRVEVCTIVSIMSYK